MNNLSKKALRIIERKGDLSKGMKITPKKLKEVTDGLVKGDFARHGEKSCFLTKRGERIIKE